jgi:hypothetical protein
MIDDSGMPIGGPAEHPRATTVLVLGVLGLMCCGILSPVAWILGKQALLEIDAYPQWYGGRSQARLGMWLGVLGTVLMILTALAFLLMLLK